MVQERRPWQGPGRVRAGATRVPGGAGRDHSLQTARSGVPASSTQTGHGGHVGRWAQGTGVRVDVKVSDVEAGLAAAAAAFADALPASVKLPAGAGKTHLLAATVRHLVADGGTVLVLTPPTAGVHPIQERLPRDRKRGVEGQSGSGLVN